MLKSGMVRALGAMSGTSLDGVDAAIVVTDGDVIKGFGPHHFRPYSDNEQSILRAALGRWQDDDDLSEACELIETAHAQALHRFQDAELIGFHGQTLAHDPDAGRTHQAGDGQILADVLGKPLVWDFRSADMQMGGQGAPLAPFFHFACAKYIGACAPVAFLNLGGVGNITWVDPSKAKPEDDGALLAFDTGPANAPINDVMMDWFGKPYDADGDTARDGTVDHAIVGEFLKHPYFFKIPPKSLDRDSFDALVHAIDTLSPFDAAATLVACLVQSVAAGLSHCPSQPTAIYVTGGGRNNSFIMNALQREINVPVKPVDAVGLNGDMLEAQAFGYLAVRVARGLPTSGPSTTGVSAAVGGGTLSQPSGN
ncbi:anhydro-N-acetylmuramic acid kinase [Nereida sp. MMG025]|uniref:anhydro-N-acetylmuramic acid kinase n=1 Tax=Nereida sp. MMG025 TaxID=2909981 RepID=UPI001EFF8E7A|nr:anhydro-N-acetylmuramic acid kinase [Nereida sp. MMG025]MCF6443467.1 anhydro-N-acetylmuramic acid kinase [Nereida sp. MMG025]